MTIKNEIPKEKKVYNDKLGALALIFSFIIPIYGLIIFFIDIRSYPKSAKTALGAALLGVLSMILLSKIQ
jgi:hypothetical protein